MPYVYMANYNLNINNLKCALIVTGFGKEFTHVD